MSTYFFRPLLTVLLLVFASASFAQPADEAKAWTALRNGGILLLRHASAPGGGDPAGFTLSDCATQRNLDATGQVQAREIGARFKAQKIEVFSVVTSQWCRCKETADLAFGKVRTDAPEFNSFFQNPALAEQQTEAAKTFLLNWSQKGALVVVTHQVNITELTNIVPAQGEGVVLQRKNKKLERVGRIQF